LAMWFNQNALCKGFLILHVVVFYAFGESLCSF
jgi:hypothetical protein